MLPILNPNSYDGGGKGETRDVGVEKEREVESLENVRCDEFPL